MLLNKKKFNSGINIIKEEEKIWKKELDKEKIFDDTVANAMANEKVEMTINKNKAMSK